MNEQNEVQDFDITTLHEVGIIINSKKEKQQHLLSPKSPDICMCKYCNAGRLMEKFRAIADSMNEKITDEITRLTDRAEQITAEAGQKKIEFTGVGTFIFQKKPVKVDDSEYLNIDEPTTRFIQEKYPDLFNTKTTVAPDKKEILNRLKDGEEIDGFKLSSESHTFKFKS